MWVAAREAFYLGVQTKRHGPPRGHPPPAMLRILPRLVGWVNGWLVGWLGGWLVGCNPAKALRIARDSFPKGFHEAEGEGSGIIFLSPLAVSSRKLEVPDNLDYPSRWLWLSKWMILQLRLIVLYKMPPC